MNTTSAIKRLFKATGLIPLLFLCAALAAASSSPAAAAQKDDSKNAPSAPEKMSIDGTVIYRERMALPDDAVLLVSLYETPEGKERSRISELRIPTEGRNVPLPFHITWTPEKQSPSGQPPVYAVDAKILSDGGVLFATPDPVALPSVGKSEQEKKGEPLVIMTYRIITDAPVAAQADKEKSDKEKAVQEKSGKAEPDKAEPAKTEQAKTEQGTAEPVKTSGKEAPTSEAKGAAPKSETKPEVKPQAKQEAKQDAKAAPASKEPEEVPSPTDILAPLPALYAATSDDKTLSLQLYLTSDHGYMLTIKGDGATPRVEAGRWHLVGNGASLQLTDPEGQVGSLVPVSRKGKTALVFPAAGMTLQREEIAEPPTAPRSFTGQFRYFADAATLRECSSGVTYLVAAGQTRRMLENIYLSKRREPGETLLVNVEAHIVYPRPKLEGTRPVIALDSFRSMERAACPGEERYIPGRKDKSDPLAAILSGKRWKLVEVYGRPARVYDNQPEPHLTFTPGQPNKGNLAGSDGCNNIVGQYIRDGAELRFLGLGATMRLCPAGEEQSTAFARALSETESWRVSGKVLELFRNGALLAVFEETAL